MSNEMYFASVWLISEEDMVDGAYDHLLDICNIYQFHLYLLPYQRTQEGFFCKQLFMCVPEAVDFDEVMQDVSQSLRLIWEQVSKEHYPLVKLFPSVQDAPLSGNRLNGLHMETIGNDMLRKKLNQAKDDK